MAINDPAISAEEQAALLEDSLSSRAEVVVAPDEVQPFGRSWEFDFAQERFVPSQSGGPLETRGVRTLEGWIEKALRTSRNAHPIYDGTYGMEGPYDLIGEPVDHVFVSELRRRIEDALLVHPRITAVTNFAAAPGEFADGDVALFVTFTCVLDEGDFVNITDFNLL